MDAAAATQNSMIQNSKLIKDNCAIIPIFGVKESLELGTLVPTFSLRLALAK